ncbi:hypothetical protein F5J12DRAFT_44626 [Pisolithus orientalis]|uniref:uncharacterized protein n=1 Tax=Pisolithus orientalis TaxID=936130 RepID=UPI002224F922|nr:uncharacterized protein F5J12DRAFT_44626 [Pisolithus orientalis]KAI6009625.1 hypothetical protein F5J12DRAFT_44626 [Pisolithus orientalis]
MTRQSSEPEPDRNAEKMLLQNIYDLYVLLRAGGLPLQPSILTEYTRKLDLDTQIQSTKPHSTRQAQIQIARIRDSADTIPRIMRARICLAAVMEVLHNSPGVPHFIRAPFFTLCADPLFAYSFPKATFPVTSDKPLSTPKKNSPTPEVTSLPTARPVDEILPVHRINALTPEATNLAMTALHETVISPIPAPTHIPTQPHSGMPSSSFPPQQLPQVSSDDIEDDEQEELEVADIMISIADSDSESTTSKSRNSTNVNSNSIPTRHLEREHVKTVYSPMRRSTKRNIDGNQEATGEGNREEDGE